MEENIKRSFTEMTNDEKIIELKAQIADRKKRLEESEFNFRPCTNLVLHLENVTYNLNVLKENDLQMLLIKIHTYYMSAKDLGYMDFELSGYRIRSWELDIQGKLHILQQNKERRILLEKEKQLDALLTNDKRTELEIAEIAKSLNL